MKTPTLLLVAASALFGSIATSAEPDSTASANNTFGIDLYGRLKAEPGNLFFSAHSIFSALAMTSAGAADETAAQMQKVLHIAAGEEAHAGYASLNTSLAAAQTGKVEMNIANALWPQNGYPFLDTFLKTTRTHYGAALTPVDYSDPKSACDVINRWVDEQTRGKIKDIVQPGVVTPFTRLVLTNAIYFKGNWVSAFDPKRTRDLPFTLGSGATAPVAMMSTSDSFHYGVADGIQILEMPYFSGGVAAGSDAAKAISELKASIKELEGSLKGYDGKTPPERYREFQAELRAAQTQLKNLNKEHGTGTDRLSMAILLPEAKDGIATLEEKLTTENLAKWLSSTRRQKVDVSIPKFKLESKFSLSGTLKSLGMTDAFSSATANFSKLTDARGIFISDVLHKAFVEVNEEGTEAAAATAVVMADPFAAPGAPPVFIADHPFFFLIRDQHSGAFLFMGRLTDPRE